MEFKHFLLTIDEDGIAVFTANHPEKLNAMDADSWREMIAFFTWADTAEEVKAIIVTGAGDKAFIAGADINSLAVKRPVDCLNDIGQDANRLIENCSKPVVCAVNGYAFGGGCEVAIACDFRIVAENALFALPETGLGILPGAGGTKRLSRLIGLGRAKDMILLGTQVDAQEAVRIGLASKCVPQDQLMDEARRVCKKLLKRGPVAIKVAKKVLNASFTCGDDVSSMLEYLALSALCGTEDKQEGVTSFLEKRKPSYKGF
ncbi:MAG: enoyl-CoA hydratase/isomerase family protein [Oscillospiraceae bacterium]|nr:enoyl-CoA hydratase/isomerase family protein [Oscillospiraceae bacterium]